jgi:LCP family protein required for cell wall assembly
MRTTLKRGIGRSAAADGNGRAVLPPGVLEPMRRYVQPPPPPRSRGRLAAAIFGWFLLAVLVVAAGLAGGLYLYTRETLNALAPKSQALKVTQKDLKGVPSPSYPATALLIGYDARAGAEGFNAAQSRSDTIMLVRADPQLKTLSLLSFPRDLVVPIYCNPAYARTTDRINSAWTLCGPRGTLDTVEKLTGLSINYLITVNFHGFKLLVNRLNGIFVDVDRRYLNTQGGPGGYAKIDLQPGYQRLDGQQALDFVRYRHTDSDIYRVARQQLFIEALKDRLASGFSVFDIPKIIGAMKGSLQVVRAAGGAPSISEIESYAGLGYHLPPGHLFRDSIQNLQPYGAFNAELVASPADVQAAADQFEHPDVTLADRANAAALGRKPKLPKKPAELKAGQITTLVLNGTTIAGLARDTSYKLALVGYHTVQLPATVLADAPSSAYTTTNVFYDAAQPNAEQAARQLKVTFGPRTVIAPLPAEIAAISQQAGNPLTVVVVGTSFGGELVNPVAHVVQVAPHTAPSVRIDPNTTRYALDQLKGKLPFRILLPTVVQSSSRLTSYTPVRAFVPVPKRHELALTYVTGGGNVYWQVIETDWTDAPILRHATGTYRIAGRSYKLFTTGGNIHMVVLRLGNASYWVVNTLRDELSNETMLAIAKGLQPLAK